LCFVPGKTLNGHSGRKIFLVPALMVQRNEKGAVP
jgi:hypothetical protein